MATLNLSVQTPDTGNTPNPTAAFTPVEGDLLFAVISTGGSTSGAVDGELTSSANGITWTAIRTHLNGPTANSLCVYVADQLVPASPVSMTVTFAPSDTGTCTNIIIGRVTGMANVGAAAVRQHNGVSNGAAAGTPAVTLGAACLTSNPVIFCMGNTSSPAGLTDPSGWTTIANTSNASPNTGTRVAGINSGFTGTTITSGGTSATSFAAIALEFDATAGDAWVETPTDNLGLTDTVTTTKVATVTPTENLDLTDTVALARTLVVNDALGLTDPTTVTGAFKYVTDISANGRYFVDQDGNPILVRGESPWSMFTDLSLTQMDTYLGNRASYGCNLMLVSMIGAVANGGPADTGATFDGVLPFVGGDPTNFNSTYWTRMDSFIAKARDLGITLMIYPMDGWNTKFESVVFNPGSISNAQCTTYGQTLATRYASYPNIIWAFGGDYQEDATVNARFNACLTGIRNAGDTRPCTIQLLYETSESHNSSFWEPKVDFDFVYTYYVTYKGVSDSYNHVWSASPITRPSLFCEGAYENSFEPHPGTDTVIRRQACWALTSGSPGDFTGQEGVWNFLTGWENDLDTTAADQLKAIRDTFEVLVWWTLIPDDGNQLVTAGRGTRVTTDSATFPASNNYVTAARAADGSLAVIYMPNASSAITVNMSQMGANPTATWVDPTSGTTFSETPGSSYSRGNNAAGATDWLLILTGDSMSGSNFTQTPSDTLSLSDTVTPQLLSPIPLGVRKQIRVEIG